MESREENAKIAAGIALSVAASHSSASLDKLALWILAGFAAGFAFTVLNLNEVTPLILVSTIGGSAKLFVMATVFALLE